MINLQTTHLPVSLGKCPIVDAVVEIRFSTNVFRQAVFGIAYEKLKGHYKTPEQLPLLQLPQFIIDSDQNLKFKPHYKLIGDNYSVQIGPDVISISPILLTHPYTGWLSYSKAIFQVLGIFYESGIIQEINRLGIRYTNFFENIDIFKKVNLSIQYNGLPLSYDRTIVKTELKTGDFINTLQISNEASRQDPIKGLLNGSIIDIDTFKEYNGFKENLGEVFEKEITEGHNIEKQIFWDLLNDEMKNDLHPKYS